MFQLSDIVAGYGEHTVLWGASLAVPPGSVVALLGPNGAGKTTMLRVATGLLRPSRGRVTLDGTDLTGRSLEHICRSGVCHIPEGRGIFPNLTVRENILLQSKPGQFDEAVAKAVEAFPILGERMNQAAATMSGGQQQMLALARAYVTDPQVILFDEVSLGLAPVVVDEIFAFLRRLASGGASLLVVEQYVTRALALADYVYMMNHGLITFAGEPAELDDEALFRSYVGADVGSH